MAQRVAQKKIRQGILQEYQQVLGTEYNVPEHVQEKAVGIVQGIRNGISHTMYKGKLLVYQSRDIISIPVGWSYRLICNRGGEVIDLLSHEDYNIKWKLL